MIMTERRALQYTTTPGYQSVIDVSFMLAKSYYFQRWLFYLLQLSCIRTCFIHFDTNSLKKYDFRLKEPSLATRIIIF